MSGFGDFTITTVEYASYVGSVTNTRDLRTEAFIPFTNQGTVTITTHHTLSL